MPSIVLPRGYSLVLGTVVCASWLNTWQTIRVLRARNAAKIDYPQLYGNQSKAADSPEIMQFNCAQRAHQNMGENAPYALLGVLFTGIKYPYIAAALGWFWIVGRIVYTVTYTPSAGPKMRLLNAFSQLSILAASSYTAVWFLRNDF